MAQLPTRAKLISDRLTHNYVRFVFISFSKPPGGVTSCNLHSPFPSVYINGPAVVDRDGLVGEKKKKKRNKRRMDGKEWTVTFRHWAKLSKAWKMNEFGGTFCPIRLARDQWYNDCQRGCANGSYPNYSYVATNADDPRLVGAKRLQGQTAGLSAARKHPAKRSRDKSERALISSDG